MTQISIKKPALVAALGIAVLSGSVMTPPKAEAAAKCGRHDQVVDVLKKKFKEERAAIGLVSNKGVMELYVSKAGNWTALFTRPNGIACIMASGSAMETFKNVALGPEV